MAEVHVIGRLAGGFDFQSNNLFCKWNLISGSAWKVLEGDTEGQTQVDSPSNEAFAVWSHPIGMATFVLLVVKAITNGAGVFAS